MKKEIFAGGAGFTAFSSVPLVADDVNAYEIVYTAPEDLSGTTFEITALRADGEKIVDSGEVSGSTARYLMKNSMHAVVGDLRVRLSVLDASGACLTTKELVFEVIEGNGTGDVTADTNYPILTELIVDMRKAISDSEAVLNDLQGEISDLHTYADGKADAALASAKSYADTKDGENLTAAKTYADTKDAENLSAAKTYADGKDTETLESAKGYADSAVNTSAASLKAYTNAKIGDTGRKVVKKIYSGNVDSVTVPENEGVLSFTVTDLSAPNSLTGANYTVTFADLITESGNIPINQTDFTIHLTDTGTPVKTIDISNIDCSYVITSVTYYEKQTAAEYADTKAAAAEENAKTYGRQTFAGALKGEKSGGIVRLDDVSALDRRLDTVVSSKNIIPFPYTTGTVTKNGVTFTVSDDGSITVNGTATDTAPFFLVGATPLHIAAGTTYAIKSVGDDAKYNETYWLSLNLYDSDGVYSAAKVAQNVDTTFYVQDDQRTIRYIGITVKSGYTANNIVIKPQIEEGTVSTAYTKHVSDLSGVSVKKYGKNFFDCYGISANSIEKPGASCALSNKYNTTIDKTALSSASDVLTVTQSAHPNETQKFSYTNGYFCIGLSNLLEGQAYTLSFDFTATDDPFSMMSDFTDHSIYVLINGSAMFYWKKGSGNRYSVSFTYTKRTDYPLRRYIEFRLYGMSGTFSAFQLEPLSTASAYVPWSAPETYTVGADGAVRNLSAYEGTTTLLTESDSVILKSKYSRDLNAAFTEIQNAIIALGGSF